jgi:ParB/RepB/Spo0J family partition protein
MIKRFPLDKIDPNPWQPRQSEDKVHIEQLAMSIKSDGLMQIPSGREAGERVQLAFGHSRLAAFRYLRDGLKALVSDAVTEWDEMPVNIVDLNDEQMFQQAIAENVKRKDLNPVETARAMQRYADDFHKNSAEIGELFGVSDATVRGTVRLLDLPKKAQVALAENRITVGTGRLLLTAAKVLDTKTVDKVMDEIDEGESYPDMVVKKRLEYDQNVERMWYPNRGERARGGHNGWLLDMKNFPNEMLAPLTAKEESEAKQAGILEQLIDPPACTACPVYIKVDGAHYCGMRQCYRRKQEAWKAQKLMQLSRTLKIGIYQPADGGYIALDSYHPSHKKAFEKRIPDLRLIDVDQYKDAWNYQDFEGLNRDIAKVVVVGPSREKLVVKGASTQGGKKAEVEKAEARAKKVFRKRRKDLLWVYTEEAQHIFDGVPLEVINRLKGWHYIRREDGIPDEYVGLRNGTDNEKLEYRRRELVWAMLDEVTSFYYVSSLVKALEKYKEITTVPPSAELAGIAAKWDEEIAGLATVSTETADVA